MDNMENKVTNIKYKQIDKDTDFKQTISAMENLMLGKKGVGLLSELGLTPGKMQKFLDEQNEKELDQLLTEYQDHIFWTSRQLAAEEVQKWLDAEQREQFSKEEVKAKLEQAIKDAEIKVIHNLIDKLS